MKVKKSGGKKTVAAKGRPAKGRPVKGLPAKKRSLDGTLSLRMRVEVMRQIGALVRRREWLQVEAAERCGISQPRINDLLRGRVERFSLDALVNIAARLRLKVRLTVEGAA